MNPNAMIDATTTCPQTHGRFGILCFGLGLALLGLAGGSARAQSTNAPPTLNYQSFRIITDRNIFDPNRRKPGEVRQDTAAAKTVHKESIALVGVMSYSKGTFAFFTGSSPEYQKAGLQLNDKIGGYKITAITPGHVVLQSTNHPISLSVGMQIEREGNGPWKIAPASGSLAEAGSSDSSSKPVAKASSGEDSDVLKRMMQRRQKELK